MSVSSAQLPIDRELPLFGSRVDSAAPRGQATDIYNAIEQSQGATGSFVGLLRDSCPTIRLSDLPFEVAQMILDSRAETIQEFFESWSESLHEQAELDKEAAKRSQMQAESLKRSQGFLLSTLDRAVNLGQLSPEEAGRIQGDDVMAMRLAAGKSVSELETAPVVASTSDEGHTPVLQEPAMSGVSLRPRED